MSIVFLAVLVLGFSRTFFFRAYFDVPSIPTYLFVHGGVASGWIVWFLVQSSLVAVNRPDLHRRLGIVGVGLAACVIAATLVTIRGVLPRMRQLGVDFETNAVGPVATVISNGFVLIYFAVLVTLAVVYRRQPEIHKRLMLWATLFAVGAAGSRVPVGVAAFGLPGIIAPISLFVVLGGPIAYDLIARGRPHIVTLSGVGLLVLLIAAPGLLAANETVQAIVLSLG
jgi:uncharacterized membrane protein YozB (DUF420 family)